MPRLEKRTAVRGLLTVHLPYGLSSIKPRTVAAAGLILDRRAMKPTYFISHAQLRWF
jgi:hypothetical protein